MYIDMVLLKKDTKSFKVDVTDESIFENSFFGNFLEKIKRMEKEKKEKICLEDIQRMNSFFDKNKIDPLIKQIVEFIELKELEELKEDTEEYDFKSRKVLKNKKSKETDSFFFYQMKEGFNVFLHPLDCEFLLRNTKDLSPSSLQEVN